MGSVPAPDSAPPVCLRAETEGRLRSQLQSPDITPGTQTQTQTRGREKKQKNTELELYLENVFIRDTNKCTHTHRGNTVMMQAPVRGPCPSYDASSVDTQHAGVIAGCHG